ARAQGPARIDQATREIGDEGRVEGGRALRPDRLCQPRLDAARLGIAGEDGDDARTLRHARIRPHARPPGKEEALRRARGRRPPAIAPVALRPVRRLLETPGPRVHPHARAVRRLAARASPSPPQARRSRNMDLSFSAEYERFREEVRAFLKESWSAE